MPTATPVQTPEAIWRRVGEEEFEFAQLHGLNAVEFGGSSFLFASGRTFGAEDSRTTTLWRSTDGTTWTAIEISTNFFSRVADVFEFDGRLLAAGYGPPEPFGRAIWESTNGIDFEQLRLKGRDDSGGFNAVAKAGPGLVGIVQQMDGWDVWTSADAIDWQRANDIEGSSATYYPTDIAVGPDGTLVVVTMTAPAEGEDPGPTEPLAFTSRDGVDWTRTILPGQGFPRDVVWTGDEFLAVGYRDCSVGFCVTTWTSSDAVAWTVHDAEVGGQLEEVSAKGQLLVGGNQDHRPGLYDLIANQWTFTQLEDLPESIEIVGIADLSGVGVIIGRGYMSTEYATIYLGYAWTTAPAP